jgi:hypothetical protein
MLRRNPLFIVALALLLALAPLGAIGVQTAHAETVVWDDGPPKGVVGADGIRCIGTASAGGHTYTSVKYVGADAGEMSSDPQRERNWQRSQCEWEQRQLIGGVPGWFKYRHGIDIDPASVRVTIEPL